MASNRIECKLISALRDRAYKRYSQALRVYQQTSINFKHSWLTTIIAECYSEIPSGQENKEHRATTLRYFEQAIEQNPRDAHLYKTAADYEMQINSRRYNVIESYYRSAININPFYLEALYSAAVLLNSQEPYPIVDADQRILWLEQATRLDPDNWFGYARLSYVYQEVTRDEDADTALHTAMVLSNPLLDWDEKFIQNSKLSKLYIANILRLFKQYEAALRIYLELNSFNEEADIMASAALCYYHVAVRDGQPLNFKVTPLNWGVNSVVARRPELNTLLRQYSEQASSVPQEVAGEQMIVWAEKSIKAAPNDARLHSLLGKYLILTDVTRAADEYRRAIELNPVFGAALFSGAALYERSSSHISLGEAIDWTERALQVSPDDPNYHFQLGNLYRKAGREEEAANAFTKALLCSQPLDEQHVQAIEQMYCVG